MRFNPKLFYYSPKYSVNLIGNINNIGELPLTTQDYFKFTGGFRNMMRKGGSSFNVSSNDLGIGGIWLMPIQPSPSYHGYDVTDYRGVNPDYGTMDDFTLGEVIDHVSYIVDNVVSV